jgi:hypothetical protein
VARYKHLSSAEILKEMDSCNRVFYSPLRILRRVWGNFWQRRSPLITLIGSLSFRKNSRLDRKAYRQFNASRGRAGTVLRKSTSVGVGPRFPL